MPIKSRVSLPPALAVVFLWTLTPGAWAEPPPTAAERIGRRLESVRAELIEVHRDLHQHPELSGQEERTARVVAERLRGLGLEVRTGVGGHGVVGLLRGGRPGPVVAYRADMDAVTSEAADPVAYRSQTPGVRHICGHDLHTTVALGIAEALASIRDELPGSVKLIFQPSEENGQGAQAMIDDGALEDPAPQAIFALHTTPLAVGQLGSKEGLLLPARNFVSMTFSGQGDLEGAATAGAEMLAAVTRIGAPGAPGGPETLGGVPLANDFIVGQPFRSESAAEENQWIFQGMLSTSSSDNLEQAKSQIAAGVAALALDEVAVELAFQDRVIPGAFNDAALVRRTNETIRSLVGDEGLVTMPGAVPFFSEDFGHFQDRVPGAMYWLGVSNLERGIAGLPHSPEFVADEEAIFVGARTMAGVLVGYLEGEGR
jgi:metal-dependent amidase/aminoacylase/carboxypeptidase family protein